MDDVLGHVMLAVGDEDLGAEHFIGAVALRHGAGAHGGQVGAGLGLGQVHGAGPAPGDQGLDVARLLRVAAGGQQRLDRAVGQQRDQCERQVRTVQHLHARRRDQLRQALAAEFGRVLHALPAGVRERAEGFLETFRGRDLAVVPEARFLVAGVVQRGDDFAAEFRVFFEHRFNGVGRGVLAAGELADLGQVGQFVHHEQHVFQGGVVAHRGLLSVLFKRYV